MRRSAQALKNARDCVLEMYEARQGTKSREELIALMDKDIWISPGEAKEYGLIDEIVGLGSQTADPAAFVAAAGGRYILTDAMRQSYMDHVAAERDAAQQEKAKRALAHIRALASY